MPPMKNTLTRRRFMTYSAASATLIGPPFLRNAYAAIPQIEAYHGKDSAYHQSRYDALSKSWRMISLSAHGSPSSPLYSAVWVKEPSPSYAAVHDLPIGRYQQWFDDHTRLGYSPVLVTATGAGGDAVVAAVFEKGLNKGWTAKHGLVNGPDGDQGTIEYWCKKARQDRQVLRSGSVYGSSS